MESLASIAAAVASGQTSPRELVEDAFAAIDAREADVRAWTHLDREGAFAAADALTAELATSGPRGPLHGVPCGIKDIFDVARMPCEWGSPAMRGRKASKDSALVRELRKAGAVILGKTVTTAFAYFDPGPTRNPHNLARTPGGSSSGSAAAVAAGMVPFAVGSQTMGSVLRPASFCGVCGFKPTFGALPLEGVMPFAPSLDHAGLFTRTVEDMRTLYGVLRPLAEAKPVSRVAALGWPPADQLEPEMAVGFAQTIERLREAGIEVAKVQAPASIGTAAAVVPRFMAREAASIQGDLLDRHGARIGSKLAQLLEGGRQISKAEYLAYTAAIYSARADYESLAAEHPVLMMPSALGPAPEGLSSTGDPRCNAPWTALGVPAVSFPFTTKGQGLPMGLQLVAEKSQEALLLATAARFEQILRGDEAVIGSD